MDKNVLIQYTDMIEEVKDIRKRILQTEKQISRIEEEGTVKDTVSGGMGGIQHFVVEGMPVLELSRKRLLLNKRKAMRFPNGKRIVGACQKSIFDKRSNAIRFAGFAREPRLCNPP